MDQPEYNEYHPIAARLWSSIVIHASGEHELPNPVEKAVGIVLWRMTEADELRWMHASVHSLCVAMASQGERQPAEALQRISTIAAKLAGDRDDTWSRNQPRSPGEPAPTFPQSSEPAGGVPLHALRPSKRFRP